MIRPESVQIQPCKPFTRWERGIIDDSAIIAPLIEQMVELGIEPLYPKRLSTTTISILTAHQLIKAANNDDFNAAKFAADFLSETDRSPLKSLSAPVKHIDLLESGYGKRSKNLAKVVLSLDCPVIKNELSVANTMFGQIPYESDIHVSFMTIQNPRTAAERRKILTHLSAFLPEQVRIQPVIQKKVAEDGATTFRSLRSLAFEYHVDNIRRQLSPRSAGQRLASLFVARPVDPKMNPPYKQAGRQ